MKCVHVENVFQLIYSCMSVTSDDWFSRSISPREIATLSYGHFHVFNNKNEKKKKKNVEKPFA